MSTTEITDTQNAYGREALLEFAKAKGIVYEKVSPRKPTKNQVFSDILSKDKDALKQLAEIIVLKKGLRPKVLALESKKLDVYDPSAGRQVLAVRIYCKDPQALKDLQLYQRTEPKQSTIAYICNEDIADNKLNDRKSLENLLSTKLTDGTDSIATLENVVKAGDDYRYIIHFDNRRRVVERNKNLKYPGRMGPHDVYPLKRIIATYNSTSRILRISAMRGKADQAVKCLSEAFTGKEDSFEFDQPSIEKADLVFTDQKLQTILEANDIKIVGLVIQDLTLDGNISRMDLIGDDIAQTIKQFNQARLPVVKPGLSKIAELTLMFNGKKTTIDFIHGKDKGVGQLSEEESAQIQAVLKGWGIYQRIY